MKIKINKQSVENLDDNILSAIYIRGGAFQIKQVDIDYGSLTSEQKLVFDKFIYLIEEITL